MARQLPNDVLAEQSVIGGVLLRPEIMGWLELRSAAFYDPRCRKVWEALAALHQADIAIDESTLAGELERRNALEAIGGLPFLSDCALKVPTSENVEHYANAVRARHVERQLILEMAEVRAAVESGEVDGAEAVTMAFERLATIQLDVPDGTRTIGEVTRKRYLQLLDLAERLAQGEIVCTGIPTGVQGLDRMLGGIQRQLITLIAARPGMGKSAVSHQIADHASGTGYGVHVFSMEDPEEGYADRTIAKPSGLPAQRLKQLHDIGPRELGAIRYAAEKYHQRAGWLVDSRGGLDVSEIIRSVRRYRERNQTQLVIVDYVQLLRRRRNESQLDMLERSIKSLLALAKNDDLAIVLLSQLNRGLESREDKRPRLPDLKGSGALEEEPKCVLFLYREHYYDPEADPTLLEIRVAKNSNGETGTVYATWDGPTMAIS